MSKVSSPVKISKKHFCIKGINDDVNEECTF